MASGGAIPPFNFSATEYFQARAIWGDACREKSNFD